MSSWVCDAVHVQDAMKTLTVSKLLIAAMMMTLQLCLAQDVAPGKPTLFANQCSTQQTISGTKSTCLLSQPVASQIKSIVVRQNSSAMCSEALPVAGSNLVLVAWEGRLLPENGEDSSSLTQIAFYAAAGVGVAVVPASNSSQEANQAASTQVPPALAAAGTTAAEALSQIPPLEGPVKLAVVLPLPPRYTDNVTAHGSGVVDAVAPAIPDPAVRVESMQPTAVVADAVLEREAVPSTYQGMLDRHNYYRAWHGAGPLSWSTALANSAAAFASWCSQGHDPNLSMNEGENLWWIEAPGSLSFLQRAVDGWCVWKSCQCTVACCCCRLDRSVHIRWQLLWRLMGWKHCKV